MEFGGWSWIDLCLNYLIVFSPRFFDALSDNLVKLLCDVLVVLNGFSWLLSRFLLRIFLITRDSNWNCGELMNSVLKLIELAIREKLDWFVLEFPKSNRERV